jgi:hypothetical protein
MANVFLNLPVPAGNGVGASVDVSGLAGEKTITVQGSFGGVVTIEFSCEGVAGPWAQAIMFSAPDQKQVSIAARFMRVRRKGVPSINPGSPNIDVGSPASTSNFADLPAPAGDGVGASVDVSAFGIFNTVTVLGSFIGTVLIEISEDGASWSSVMSFAAPGWQSAEFTAQFMRVRRKGTNIPNATPGLPNIDVGAIDAAVMPLPAGETFITFTDTAGTTNVYVDGVNGSDDNDGLTPITALETIGEVYRKFPWQMMGEARLIVNLLNPNATQLVYEIDAIHIGGGNQALIHTYVYRGPAMVLFTPVAGPSTAALDAVPCQRVDQVQAASGTGNRTSFDFTTAAPGWTVNDLAGSFLRVTRGGVKVLWEIPITENTADRIFVDSLGIVGVVLNTDTVEIVQPGVKIQAPPAGSSFGILTIINRSAALGANGATPYSVFERIEFGTLWARGIADLTFDRCKLSRDAVFGFINIIQGFSIGFANSVVQGGILLCGNAAGDSVRRADAVGNPINTTGALTDLQGAPRVGEVFSGIQIGHPRSLFVPRQSGVYVAQAPLSSYRATGSGAAGIFVSGPGSMLLMATGVSLNGRGNANSGLRCYFNGVARINGGVLSTLTGTSGSLRLSTGAIVAYGTGAGQFEEAAGFNGNFTRMLEGSAAAPTGDVSAIVTRLIIAPA